MFEKPTNKRNLPPEEKVPFTKEEILKAFSIWNQRIGNTTWDHSSHELLHFKSPNVNQWLKIARKSLFLSLESVSSRLEISKNAYAKLEASEERGSISLNSLQRAAESMDCELVYFIRPKTHKPFSVLVWEKLFRICESAPRFRKMKEGRRSMALASLALATLKDPEFRRKNGFTQIWRD